MQIKIKQFDTSLPMPEYKSEKAAALDLYVRVETVIEPGGVTLVPLNVALEIPKDHFVLLTARSSLHKSGLMMANGVGIGDADYCGDDDEYMAPLYNFTQQPVTLEKGQRVAQMIILPREQVELLHVDRLGNSNRGGFGSTGKK